MLDERNSKVLDVVIDFCGSGEEFKILDAADIIAKLPESLEVDKDALVSIIKELKDRELLKLKYSTADEYCLAVLPKAFIVKEEERALEAVSTSAIVGKVGRVGKNWDLKTTVFVAGLCGSGIGGIIVAAISAIINALM